MSLHIRLHTSNLIKWSLHPVRQRADNLSAMDHHQNFTENWFPSFCTHMKRKKSNEDSRCEKTNKTANETLSYKSLPLLPWRCHHKSSTRKYQRKCAEVQTLSVSHWNRWSYEVQPNLTYQHSGESFASTINIQDNHASDNDTQTPKPCFYSTFKS